ncbi:thioredoxin domain-containing protein [Coccinella septempunctata]|uniref:thioredoxin domain-containing protein n=1 Tax=Coccinella septempunctata TaxID=41139 RepID=UPI001D091B01|nr:thioredoxin domain-containing protein [Coccinella septempunctata]
MSYLIFAILIFGIFDSTLGNLEAVKDDELVELIRNEKYLIVLFTQKNCEECSNLENELIGLREVLVEEIDAWVVKVENSQMTRLYSPGSVEPVLVFFRHGIPLLYHGEPNEEEILQMFTANKEPVSKELTDETFEHLTQAGTGATTGDWFVMFYTSDCIECQRLQAIWEAVGAKIKSRTNIARVNRATTGAATARRFNIYEVPAFVFFRLGKMYRYNFGELDVDSLVTFAQNSYRHMKHESVPTPKTPFDDLIALIIVYLKDYPWLWQAGLGIFCIIVLEILRRIVMSRR